MTTHIQDVVNELATMLVRKNEDYAPADEFSNFRQAGELAGVDVDTAILVQVGIKYTRLMKLVHSDTPNFESVRDTFMDLAGYALIAAAYRDSYQFKPKVVDPAWLVPLDSDE